MNVSTAVDSNERATDIPAAIRVRCSIAALRCVAAIGIRLSIAGFRLAGIPIWVAAVLVVPAVGHCARGLGGEVVWKCLAYVCAAEATETCADRPYLVTNVRHKVVQWIVCRGIKAVPSYQTRCTKLLGKGRFKSLDSTIVCLACLAHPAAVFRHEPRRST